MKRYVALLLVLALALVAALGPSSNAQEPGSYRDQAIVGVNQALTTTVASVVTAVTGKSLRVKSISIGAGAAGTVQFYSGTDTTEPLFAIRVPADTTITLDERHLGIGPKTTSGEALSANSVGNLTAVMTIRYQKE